jgi:hypothetical protein
MVFHSPQSGHFPSHFGDWQPHFWQAYNVLIFAILTLLLLAA